jgi:hypothetical protein
MRGRRPWMDGLDRRWCGTAGNGAARPRASWLGCFFAADAVSIGAGAWSEVAAMPPMARR